jgi:hypothetical protein
MADEDEQPTTSSSQETAVGHSVVEQPEAPAGDGTTEVFFSRDQAQTSSGDSPPTPPPPRSEPSGGGSSPAAADRISADQEDPFSEKPHLYAAGAFVGAFVFAQILKRITGGGD